MTSGATSDCRTTIFDLGDLRTAYDSRQTTIFELGRPWDSLGDGVRALVPAVVFAARIFAAGVFTAGVSAAFAAGVFAAFAAGIFAAGVFAAFTAQQPKGESGRKIKYFLTLYPVTLWFFFFVHQGQQRLNTLNTAASTTPATSSTTPATSTF